MGKAHLTTHTARQIVFNLNGFKQKKELQGGTWKADDIARFWKENVRLAPGQAFMGQSRTVDTCLTLFERLFSLPDVDEAIRSFDALSDSPFNSLWKLQEFVYRAHNSKKIAWVILEIADAIARGKIESADARLE